MYNQIIEELEILKQSFDNEDIVSYQLFLIKIKKIIDLIDNEQFNETEKQELSDYIRNYLVSLNLNRIFTISDLNELFIPEANDLDINNKNIYITIFNLFVEELSDVDNIFSQKLKYCITNMISRIATLVDETMTINNTVQETVANKSEQSEQLEQSDQSDQVAQFVDIINTNSFDIDIDITNKNYLKEYIMRKNLKPYKCDICGLSSWQNNPLMLYLYSKNHIYSNKNLENLMFLCPNCYSQIGE